MVQPPLNPPDFTQIANLVTTAATTIAGFVTANPLVAVFLLAAAAVLAELPPVALLIVVFVGICYLIR